ncbi:hypothetical protein [Mycobacterium lepromatosis]|uniref:hypothetical protein n=1 Tax=Mycobacterium lepromatosis TaxID=480418 RepID=UPI000A48D151|nr:hypothetical protein [Mycobacterium lepromatosis]
MQANTPFDEWHKVGELLHNHFVVVVALRRCGITYMDNVLMNVSTYRNIMITEPYRSHRLAWANTWVKSSGYANPYETISRDFTA